MSLAATAEVERDDPGARHDATAEWRGERTFSVLEAAARERDRWNMSGARRNTFGPVQGNTFINIGPDRADSEFNDGLYFEIDSGRARQVVPHPWNKGILYLSTATGGVWKSYDAGGGWEPISDALGTTAIGTLAMDPSNPDILYVGFGDPFDVAQPGLVKSTDAGATWSPPAMLVTTEDQARTATIVPDIKVDPRNSAVVLAGTDVGLFRSVDGGASFQQVQLATPNPAETMFFVWSLSFLGNDTWLASGQVVDPFRPTSTRTNVGKFALWRSTDDGATWSWNGGALPRGASQAALLGRATLATAASTLVDPSTARVYMLAAALQGDATYDLFRSEDGGATFLGVGLNASNAPTNPLVVDQPNLDILHDQAWYNQAIAVDPLNPDRVLVGGNLSLVQSLDAGATWTILTNWLPTVQQINLPYVHADLHSIAFGADGTIYTGSDGGIGASDGNGGFTSHKNIGIVTHLAYSVTCAPESWPPELQGFVAGGLQDNGTRMRIADGTTFNQVLGGDGIGMAVSAGTHVTANGPVPDAILTSVPGRIYKSVDGGQRWTQWAAGFGADQLPFFVRLARDNAALDGQTFITYTASPAKVFQSSGGGSWGNISGTLVWPGGSTTTGFTSPNGAPIQLRNITAHPNQSGIYGVVSNKFAYVTPNFGVNWWVSQQPAPAGADAGIGIYQLSSIAFDPRDLSGRTYYVSSNAMRLANTDGTFFPPIPPGFGHLYKTTDAGQTWTSLGGQDVNSGGLPPVPVQTIAVDPGDANTLYAGTDLGLYRSIDNGANWTRFGAGSLPMVEVDALCIAPGSSRLTVATYGRGFWQIGTGGTDPAGVRGDGDMNFDQLIDGLDLIDLADAMGTTQTSARYRWKADLVGSVNAIDAADRDALLARFGERP